MRTVAAGTELVLTGRSRAGDWLQTAEGTWIFAALVTGAPTNLPVVEGAAPSAPQRSRGGVVIPPATPVPAPSGGGGSQWPAYTCTENPSPPPDPACPIKGNISSGGQIFHVPEQRDYCKTVIDLSKGEQWFCSEAEAVAAGWRAAMR